MLLVTALGTILALWLLMSLIAHLLLKVESTLELLQDKVRRHEQKGSVVDLPQAHEFRLWMILIGALIMVVTWLAVVLARVFTVEWKEATAAY